LGSKGLQLKVFLDEVETLFKTSTFIVLYQTKLLCKDVHTIYT